MYHEAVDVMNQLLFTWHSAESDGVADHIRSHLLERDGAAPSLTDVKRSIIHELTNADPFFVTPEIATVLQEAAADLPSSVAMDESLVPTRAGFCYIPSLKFMFTWEQLTVRPSNGSPSHEALSFTTYGLDSPPFINEVGVCYWPFGETWDGWTPADGSAPNAKTMTDRHRALILSLFTFLKQKIFIPTKMQVPRATARRWDRSNYGPPPLVTIVQLREAVHQGGDSGHHDVDWQCRWLVGGHWRKQWYPAQRQHHAIYVAPYLKGPEGKPLRAASARRLFVVAR